jgi:hypothetical protein
MMRKSSMGNAQITFRLTLLSLMVLAMMLGMQSSAQAAFEQSFNCQIKANGPANFEPAGVAVDEAGLLFVSEPKVDEPGPGAISEFNSSCAFMGPAGESKNPQPLPLQGMVKPINGSTTHESLSIDYQSMDFFTSGNGTKDADSPFVEIFDPAGTLQSWNTTQFGGPTYVAVDNSKESLKDPSACGTFPLGISECIVYVTHGQADPEPPSGRGLPQGIERFSTSGSPVDFEGCPGCSSYVSGNEILGTPSGGGFEFDRPAGIALDSSGDIYVTNGAEVDEYRPSGEFVRRLVGEKTPGLGGSHENDGFGGTLSGVTVDPVSGLLAVSISRSVFGEPSKDEGAVDEFDSENGNFLNQITTSEDGTTEGEKTEAGHLDSAGQMTFDPNGDLYVVDGVKDDINVYGPGRFVPAFRLAAASNLTSESAVLNDWLNPESSSDPESPELTECYFQYTTEESFKQEQFLSATTEQCIPSSGSTTGNDIYQEFHADVGSLSSGTTYYYRLAGRIGGVLGGVGFSEPVEFTVPHSPRVDSTSVTNRSSTFADLHALVDPLGASTAYHFEYVTEGQYAVGGYADAKVTPLVNIGVGGPTGNADASVVQQIGGLAPETTYRVRVVAENEVDNEDKTTHGTDVIFTTLPTSSTILPDQRAYEMLTPVNKEGAADMFAYPGLNGEFINHDVGYSSESGDEFLLETDSAFGPFPAAISNRYLFTRSTSAKAWAYKSFASSSLGVQRITSPIFDPSDFTRVGFGDSVGSEASEGGSHLLDLVGTPGGEYTNIFTGTEPSTALGSSANTIEVGASQELDSVILESLNHTLAPGAQSQDEASHTLYEWDGNGACEPGTSNCRVVDFAPNGSVFKCGAVLGQGPNPGRRHGAVSADGSKIFFTAPDPFILSNGKAATTGCWNGSEGNVPQLYIRVNGETVEVSAPEPGVTEDGKAPASHPAVYIGASEDGSEVFFLTETALTQEAVTLGLHDPELYEYNTETKRLTRISAGEPGYNGVLGTGNLSAAKGEGEIASGSDVISGLITTSGRFVVGQVVAGSGILTGTTIVDVEANSLTLSTAASRSESDVALNASSTQVSEVKAVAGSGFAVGQYVTGQGIRPGTTIAAAGPGTLTLSALPLAAEGEVHLNAGDPDVNTVPAISSSGNAVYFTAFGALVPGLAPLNPGQIYLYRYDVGSGSTTYVATVSEQDYPDLATEFWWESTSLPKDVALAPEANWETTADGAYLLFASSGEPMPDHSSAGPCTLPGRGIADGHCDELYRYHYEQGAGLHPNIVCISCDRDGEDPVSNAEFARSAPNGSESGPVRAISNDGSYVFFDSADPLVPQASNGTLNVYEWENYKVGGCADVEGCISLISSGADAAPSFFLGTDITGNNVFFGTHASLVRQDADTDGDLYDARICSPEEPCSGLSAEKTAECEGDACQSPAPSPVETTPVSLTFSGESNFAPPPKSSVRSSSSLTRAQKLAKALKICDTKPKRKRAACRAQARSRYGPKAKAKKSGSSHRKANSERSKR